MQKIKKLLPLTKREQRWKNPKFHLLLHFTDVIICLVHLKNMILNVQSIIIDILSKNQEEGLKKK